jgi:hypothetical protein
MRQLIRGSFILLVATIVLTATASGAGKVATIKAASGAMETGVGFFGPSTDAENATQFKRIRATGAKYVQIRMYWRGIAPSGSTQPAGFQPADPADPNYNWNGYDMQVKGAAAAGLKPIVSITAAPRWAEGSFSGSDDTGAYKPSPSEFAKFLTAVGKRYSGSFQGLPRVQYWAIWNEPNYNTFLSPQNANKKSFATNWYRSMLNAAAGALHAVKSSNVVIGGETGPFGVASTRGANSNTMPLVFMEKVLCIGEKINKRTKVVSYKSVCKTKTKVDAWSHHPYTQGGPTVKAKVHGNVSLGDMGEMRSVMNAALKANHVVSRQKVRLWVTEISWDSKPPDPKAVPIALETRWVSEMLYRMWGSGVSFVNWFILRDQPLESSLWQSGLYYAGSSISSDRAKPVLRAFRFPFVAFPQVVSRKTVVQLWGRTPKSSSGNVVIERKSGSKWKRVKTLKANGSGIFKASIPKPASTVLFRARLANGSDQSAEFSLKTPKHPWKGCVWGTC